MYNVEFFTFSKKQNSTARPAGAGTVFPCRANTSFDILAPSVALNTGTYPGNYNYCYIPEFGRYYYCTFRFDASTGLWWADCQVDALASWKPQIGALSGYVLRSYYEGDETVPDNMWPQITDVGYEQDNLSNPWDLFPQNGTFVVGIAGSGATSYYWFTFIMLDVFLKYLYSSDYADEAVGWLPSTLNPEIKAQLNPLQYITSIVWLPFQLTAAAVPATSLNVGFVNVIGKAYGSYTVSAYEVSTLSEQFFKQWNIKRHPYAAVYGKWASANLAEVSIRISPFGNISLDPLTLATSDGLVADVYVDIRTGYATLEIRTAGESGNTLLSHVTGQVGMPIQLGSVVAPGTGMASLLPSIVSGVSAVAAGIATGGAAGVAIGAAGVASAGLGAIGTIGQNRVSHANTIGGAPNVAALDYMWTVFYKWYNIAETDYQDKGRPLCKVKRLDTLPGYQLVGDIHVDIPCTEQEKNTITATLTGGYYFE
jgi:hypothetical protein